MASGGLTDRGERKHQPDRAQHHEASGLACTDADQQAEKRQQGHPPRTRVAQPVYPGGQEAEQREDEAEEEHRTERVAAVQLARDGLDGQRSQTDLCGAETDDTDPTE